MSASELKTKQTEHDAAFEAWCAENDESLSRAWREHLSEMQDTQEHIAMLSRSDAAFEEFAYEHYCDYVVDVNAAAADAEGAGGEHE